MALNCCWIQPSPVGAAPQKAEEFSRSVGIEMTASQHRECVAETGVSEESIARFNGPEIFEDDEKLKCYMDCMFRKFGATKPDGEVDMIEVYHKVPRELNSVALIVNNKCRDAIQGANLCERAFSHHKCWKQMAPEVNEFVNKLSFFQINNTMNFFLLFTALLFVLNNKLSKIKRINKQGVIF